MKKNPEHCEFNATRRQGLTVSPAIACYCLKASKRNVLNGGKSLTAVATIFLETFEKNCPALQVEPPAFVCARPAARGRR